MFHLSFHILMNIIIVEIPIIHILSIENLYEIILYLTQNKKYQEI